MTENGNELVMPVQPMGGYGYGGGMGGFGYGSDFWLILILLFAFGGGWGGFGGYGGMGGFAADGAMLYPWMNQAEITTNGFQNQGLNSAISSLQNSVTSGFGDVQLGLAGINQNICQSTAGVTQAMANGFAQAEIANNGRQIANMQTAFANQTAMNQGFNGVQSQLAQCCCDNKLLGVQTQGIIQNEGNATRYASANNTRDIIENCNRNNQAILDKLCALELDGYKRENDNLRTQLNLASLQASQNAQTSQIESGQRALANEIEQYVAPNPKPAYIVQSPYCCNQAAYGCGCGM